MQRRRALVLGLVLAGATLAPFTRGAPIVLEGTKPGDLVDEAPANVDAQCGTCHSGNVDADGKSYRPWDTWSGTMMAQAMRDPLFLAALTVAEQDVKDVGTYCLRCHTPGGFVKGNATGLGEKLDDDDKQGITCEACHRSTDPSKPIAGKPPVDPKGPYVGNGRLFWDSGRRKHGPHADANSPSHETMADPFTGDSRLCGQCHELASPLITMKEGGVDTKIPFPLDTTFTEWSTSSFGKVGADFKSCADCHMPRAKGSLTTATAGTAKDRKDPRTHLFMGGNVWGIDAVKFANPTVAADRGPAFDDARAMAETMLKSAVTVELVSPPKEARAGDKVKLVVKVENRTGHKFPTGYADGRRAFLRVELVTADGATIAITGAYDDAKADLIKDPQLRLYEVIHAAEAGGKHVEWHIAKHDTLVKDTRLVPKGFVPGPTTKIVGADYSDGKGGTRNWDEATIELPIDATKAKAGDVLTVRATVFYQATEKAFIEELDKANVTDDKGKKLTAIWNATGKAAPIALAKQEAKLTVLAAAPPDAGTPGDAGVPTPDASLGDDASTPANPAAPGESSGCGCTNAGSPSSSIAGSAIAFALAMVSFRRRRRG